MSRIRGYCLALLFPFAANAVESNFPLYDMEPNLHDQASLQRGAATYMNYCLGCHSLGYQRYKRTAEDLGIPRAFDAGILSTRSQCKDWRFDR